MPLEPGFHEIDEETYHGDPCAEPSLSCSLAKVLINDSCLHAYHAHPRLGGKREDLTSDVMDFGTLGHKLLLGKGAEIAVGQFDDWRKNDAKEFREKARNSGLVPVLQATMDRAREMQAGVTAELTRLGYDRSFSRADKEVAAIWKDGPTWMRSKFDAINRDGVVDIFDLKITKRARPADIERQIGAMNYDLQDSFYRAGVLALLPDMAGRIFFTFLFCESEFPFSVVPVVLGGEFQEIGRMKFVRALTLWRQCMVTGKWPGYVSAAFRPQPKPWDIEREAAAEI